MSSLRKTPEISAAALPKDYTPQHPLHEWRPGEPFEATENPISKKWKARKAKKAAKKAALAKQAGIIAKAIHNADDTVDKARKAAVDAGVSAKSLKKKVIKLTPKSERKEAAAIFKAMAKK